MARGEQTIRSIARALAVLEALAQFKFATASAIASAAGLPRPTAYRILETLIAEGYVQRAENSDVFRLTGALKALARKFEIDAEATAIAAGALSNLSRKLVWPVDFATYEDGRMVVRHSTHPTSPKSLLNGSSVGHRLLLTQTAPGRAFLANLPRDEAVAALVRASEADAVTDGAFWRMLKTAKQRGFAFRDGGVMPNTSSIAVPVLWQGRPIACISVMFIRTALTIDSAAELYLGEVKKVVGMIEGELQSRE